MQKFNDSVKPKMKARSWLTRVFWRQVEIGASNQEDIDRKTKQRSDMQEELDNGVQHPQSLVQTNTVLYFGKLAVSNRSSVHLVGKGVLNLQKQFDAARAYRPIYKSYRQQQRLKPSFKPGF